MGASRFFEGGGEAKKFAYQPKFKPSAAIFTDHPRMISFMARSLYGRREKNLHIE
jgi:hypothetical protein